MEEQQSLCVISELQQRVGEEYDALQKKHDNTQSECRRLEQERDEALHKLQHFHTVSELVLEEVGQIQKNLQIQQSCRENAEALATKLSRENRSLKRRSMMFMSHLSPDLISHINLLEPDPPDPQGPQEPQDPQNLQDPGLEQAKEESCKMTLTDLQEELARLLQDKTRSESELQELRAELESTRQQLLKEKHDNTLLISEKVQLNKLLNSYNRVSLLALEEFEELQVNLDLEKNLRTEAESFAQEMFVEQKKLKRQSQILVQNVAPGQVLSQALDQVQRLTGDLERERLEHQLQVKALEQRLSCSDQQREMESMRGLLQIVQEEKEEVCKLWTKARDEAKDLRFTVEELQKKVQTLSNPSPGLPAPPLPPPPPPPPPTAPLVNPLSSLLSLMRRKKEVSADIPLTHQDSPSDRTGSDALPPPCNCSGAVDVRQQAVDEMMQRIKKGVQLRPVNQSASRARRQLEKKPSNSAIQELKGIMANFNQSSPSPRNTDQPRDESTERDSELRQVLLRRRDALETTAGRTTGGGIF